MRLPLKTIFKAPPKIQMRQRNIQIHSVNRITYTHIHSFIYRVYPFLPLAYVVCDTKIDSFRGAGK